MKRSIDIYQSPFPEHPVEENGGSIDGSGQEVHSLDPGGVVQIIHANHDDDKKISLLSDSTPPLWETMWKSRKAPE